MPTVERNLRWKCPHSAPHCTLYSVQCALTVYSVQLTVYSVQCTVFPCVMGELGGQLTPMAKVRREQELPSYSPRLESEVCQVCRVGWSVLCVWYSVQCVEFVECAVYDTV